MNLRTSAISVSLFGFYCFSVLLGGLIPKNIHPSGQEILVEKHQNDDHNWPNCCGHPHPYHFGCYWCYLKQISTLTQDWKDNSIISDQAKWFFKKYIHIKI